MTDKKPLYKVLWRKIDKKAATKRSAIGLALGLVMCVSDQSARIGRELEYISFAVVGLLVAVVMAIWAWFAGSSGGGLAYRAFRIVEQKIQPAFFRTAMIFLPVAAAAFFYHLATHDGYALGVSLYSLLLFVVLAYFWVGLAVITDALTTRVSLDIQRK